MEGSPEQPRLFFLGAGFARPAGMPLAPELLDLVLSELAAIGGETHLHRSLKEYKEYKEATTGERPHPIDIEDFVAFLDHQHFFGMLGTDTWAEEGNRDQYLLRWGVGRVLHRRTRAVDELPALYLRFAEQLRPRDLVVTFNYDLLLERALEAVGGRYRRFPGRMTAVGPTGGIGETEIDPTEVVVLKLHGSLDWVSRASFERKLAYVAAASGDEGVAFARERDLVFGERAVTTTRPLVEGPRFENDPLKQVEVIEDLDAYYQAFRVAFEHPPLILAPSQAKQLYGGALRELWPGLSLYGWTWAGFSIIGYSLPPADPYTRQVLYEIARSYTRGRENADWRLGPMNEIIVVDKRDDEDGVRALREAYRFLPDEHTTFVLDGFDEETLAALFATA